MGTEHVAKYNELLAKLYENRDKRFKRTPIDNALEEKFAEEMVGFFSSMTKEEQDSVERPEPPRIRTSLIAQDQYGRLIGFEDLDDPGHGNFGGWFSD